VCSTASKVWCGRNDDRRAAALCRNAEKELETMRLFWETVIEPIFEILQPGVIVEIGSSAGGNTSNILEYCQRSGATLHVIDPAPKYDIPTWQRRHGDNLVFHEDLSLNALPQIEGSDVVLIDGDHNWYTVYNELRVIEARCAELSRPFPLVMLHDVGWPYGRRDMYYNPETIPEEYRKPHAQKGMHPDSRELLEEGGSNSRLNNALLDNEPRSGVLTAVEDFMETTEQELELLKIPGINGLGILVPSKLKEHNEALAAFLSTLDFPEAAVRHVELVERIRWETQVRMRETKRRRKASEERLRDLERETQRLRRQIEDMKSSRGWKVAHGINVATLKLRAVLGRLRARK